MEFSANAADNLKLIRKYYGYSLQYVSIRTGVERSRLSKIENRLILVEVSTNNQRLYLDLVERKVKLNLDLFRIAKCFNSY